MNRIRRAAVELAQMDERAALKSPVHSRSPVSKWIVTVAFILFTLSFHRYDLFGLLPMVLWLVLMFQLGGLEIRSCLYQMRMVLPLVLMVGVFNPFFDRETLFHIGGVSVSGGVISMLTLMLKGLYCVMASWLLIATTRLDALCAGLRQLHVPKLLVTLLLLTFRYVGLMLEELAVMTEAYSLRAPGQKGIHFSAWGSFLGQLLLRSMDRAQELYASMLLRGYSGEFYYADPPAFGWRDGFYIAASVSVFLFLRFFPLALFVGGRLIRG